MLASDVVRVAGGVALLGAGAWSDLVSRTARRFLWHLMGVLGLVLVAWDVASGSRAWHDAAPFLAFALAGGLLVALVMRFARAGGADWRACLALAVLFPFQLGRGPPVWVAVVALAAVGALAWGVFRPARGVPFLVPLFVALLVRVV